MPCKKKSNLSRRTRQARKARIRKLSETKSQREMRLEVNRIRAAERIANETIEKRTERLKLQRYRSKTRISARRLKQKYTENMLRQEKEQLAEMEKKELIQKYLLQQSLRLTELKKQQKVLDDFREEVEMSIKTEPEELLIGTSSAHSYCDIKNTSTHAQYEEGIDYCANAKELFVIESMD